MEARAMARIRHDGIVQVLDAGTDAEGRVYIALELLDGESLEAMLLRERTLPWSTTVTICTEVLDALAEALRDGRAEVALPRDVSEECARELREVVAGGVGHRLFPTTRRARWATLVRRPERGYCPP
jgi:serine/threonine protein kinase